MTQLGFYVNMNECTGCRCCQVACKDKNDLPVGVFFRQVLESEGGVFPGTWAATFSKGCNHCQDAACVKNCPVAAISKDAGTGLVLQDKDMCIGCQRCTMVCPYSAPAYNEKEDVVRKCDGCFDWVSNGLQPACVGACSTRCLQFGPIDELELAHSGESLVKDTFFLPSSTETGPNILINPKPQVVVVDAGASPSGVETTAEGNPA